MSEFVQYKVDVKKSGIFQKTIYFDTKEKVIEYIYKSNLELGEDDLLKGYLIYTSQTYVVSFSDFLLSVNSTSSLVSFWELACSLENSQRIDALSNSRSENEVIQIMRKIKNNQPKKVFTPPTQKTSDTAYLYKEKENKENNFLESVSDWGPVIFFIGFIIIIIGAFTSAGIIGLGGVLVALGALLTLFIKKNK